MLVNASDVLDLRRMLRFLGRP